MAILFWRFLQEDEKKEVLFMGQGLANPVSATSDKQVKVNTEAIDSTALRSTTITNREPGDEKSTTDFHDHLKNIITNTATNETTGSTMIVS